MVHCVSTKTAADFNPRTLKGYDVQHFVRILREHYFNPRTLKGYDLSLGRMALLLSHFNPRTLKGYDQTSPVSYSTKF